MGFTQLGEFLPAEELGRLARRLEAIAATVVRPPTTVAKMIGDAVMLIGPDPTDLLETTVALIERAGEPRLFTVLRDGPLAPSGS